MTKRPIFCFLMVILYVYLSTPTLGFGQDPPLVEEVLEKYLHVFQREDIAPVMPDALRGLKADYVQGWLRDSPGIIERVIADPDLLRTLLPGLDVKYITLLKEALPKENGELKALLTDPQAQKVLQDTGHLTEVQKTLQDPTTVARLEIKRFGISVALRASPVPQDRIVFNEIYNAATDKNDWVELKNISEAPVSLKGWEISRVNASPIQMAQTGRTAGADADIVTFRDYTLPAGGVLLIVNTDPSETHLIPGEDITDPGSDPTGIPQYLVAPKLRLSSDAYLLILRSARDKNGTPEAVEDIVGNYFRGDIHYHTQVWPLRATHRPTGDAAAPLTQGNAYRRTDTAKRGYLREAWTLSGYQSGVGYRAGTPSIEASLGTPGYPNDVVVDQTLVGRITFSEVMFATTGGLFSKPQWIELYNNTTRAETPVNLKGWQVAIEGRNPAGQHRYVVVTLDTLELPSQGIVLLVTRKRRHSRELAPEQIYDLYEHHSDNRKLGLRENTVLRPDGFGLKLIAPDGTVVDTAGNLNAERGREKPKWHLPSGVTETGARTSIIREYEAGIALTGTEVTSWQRAADMGLPMNRYYGHKSDIGTPGFRGGGINPVSLSGMHATRTETGVLVEWVTEAEVDNAGFNILRSQTRQGVYVKVNAALVPGHGTTAERHVYTYTDTTARPTGAYYYQLQDVSFSGVARRSQTVRMRGHLSANGKVLKKWADVKRR